MMMLMMKKMNLQRRRKAPPTTQMLLLPSKARRIRSVAESERQTFQLSQCAWDLLEVWKKGTGKTLIHMQIAVFVEKRTIGFNDFDREVTVTSWDREGERQSLRIVSAAM
jgi:hypothetical protein